MKQTVKMPSQLIAPIPISPKARNMHLLTSADLFASLNATLSASSSKTGEFVTIPDRRIREHDYTVPAPPPPSPVSFRTDHWGSSTTRRS